MGKQRRDFLSLLVTFGTISSLQMATERRFLNCWPRPTHSSYRNLSSTRSFLWQLIIDVSEEGTAPVLKISAVLCIVCVCVCVFEIEARGGSGTALQAGGRGLDSRWGPSGLTIALESTQPLTEMSTRGI
jgi:hypothetical protein